MQIPLDNAFVYEYNSLCKVILWGGVKFPTGGKSPRRSFCDPERVKFLHRRYSPEGKRITVY